MGRLFGGGTGAGWTRCALIVSLALAVTAVGFGPQGPQKDDLAGFAVEIANDVAAVEQAPLTVEITRIGENGIPDAHFDWVNSHISLVGLEDLNGKRISSVDLVPSGETGGRKTRMKLEEGRLLLSNAVIVGEVAVEHQGRRTTLISDTVWGWGAILPPIAAIILAVLTRQVLFALFAGVWLGACFIFGGPWAGFRGLATVVLPDSLDGERVRIVMFSCLLGSVVAMVARMGGTKGIVDLVSRMGNTRVGAMFTTWLSGLFVFFDDYANALLVGNTMRPITDKYRVSREKLAYLVDSTSAPVACVVVISTWIVAEVSYIEGKLRSSAMVREGTGLEPAAAYQTFLETIPYNFYPILALAFALFICLSRRDFGPMLRAENRASREGKLLADGAKPLSSREMDELQPVDPARIRWFNAALPILTVILGVLGGIYFSGQASIQSDARSLRAEVARLEWQAAHGNVSVEENLLIAAEVAAKTQQAHELDSPPLKDIFGQADSYQALMIAALLGVLVAVGLALAQRLMSLGDCMDTVVAGIKSMIPAILVLILAWTLQGICERLNTSQYLIHHVAFTLTFLPLVVFLLSAAVGFATGTSWGTMGILVPLTMEYAVGLAVSEGMDPMVTRQVLISSVGGVLAGAVFGDHCSPISDTTIMSSMSCGCDHIDHVRTQLPYATVVAGIACVVGYLPVGFIVARPGSWQVSPWWLLLLGTIVCFLTVRLLGKRVPDSLHDTT